MSARPEWAVKLYHFISDELDLPEDDSADVTIDLIEDAVNEILCRTFDHEIIDDQCGILEHRYCVWCGRREVML